MKVETNLEPGRPKSLSQHQNPAIWMPEEPESKEADTPEVGGSGAPGESYTSCRMERIAIVGEHFVAKLNVV